MRGLCRRPWSDESHGAKLPSSYGNNNLWDVTVRWVLELYPPEALPSKRRHKPRPPKPKPAPPPDDRIKLSREHAGNPTMVWFRDKMGWGCWYGVDVEQK